MTTADEQRRLADLLEQTAAELPGLMTQLGAFHRPDVWSGRRAERFGDELDDRRRQTRVTAEELLRQAAEMRSRSELYDLLIGPLAPP